MGNSGSSRTRVVPGPEPGESPNPRAPTTPGTAEEIATWEIQLQGITSQTDFYLRRVGQLEETDKLTGLLKALNVLYDKICTKMESIVARTQNAQRAEQAHAEAGGVFTTPEAGQIRRAADQVTMQELQALASEVKVQAAELERAAEAVSTGNREGFIRRPSTPGLRLLF
jgi:hypothetical protein